MTISLNDKVIKKSGLSLGEVLLMIAIQNNVDFHVAESELKKKGFISTSYNQLFQPEGLFVTSKGNNMVNIIWKEEVKDGTKVPISELANYIENEGQTDSLTDNWTSTLV